MWAQELGKMELLCPALHAHCLDSRLLRTEHRHPRQLTHLPIPLKAKSEAASLGGRDAGDTGVELEPQLRVTLKMANETGKAEGWSPNLLAGLGYPFLGPPLWICDLGVMVAL